MSLAFGGATNEGVLLLVAAALVLYGASRLALHALAHPDGSDPGRRAIGQWLPIAAAAIGAVLLRQPEVAVSIILGSSVTCLSLVTGLVTLMAPMEMLPPGRRVWPFLMPAALIPLMAGFSGHLGPWHAGAMLLFGFAVLAVWLQEPQAIDVPSAAASTAAPSPRTPRRAERLVLLVVALLLCAAGAYLSIRGTLSAASQSRYMTAAVVATVILCPLLMLPTIGTASAVAQHGQVGRALTALVGTVLLNLCLLLPIAVFLHMALPANPASASGPSPLDLSYFQLSFRPASMSLAPLPYPMAAWRIDNVLLVVLGFATVPIATGRWLIGRGESLLLIMGYMTYLVAQAVVVLK